MSHNHPDEHYEQRIASLEESVKELRKNQIEGHKWFTTIMFTLVALLLTVLGLSSKSDVREAIRDMKTDVRDATSDMQGKLDNQSHDMEKRFAELSGEALKKPRLEISTTNGPLNGQEWGMSGPNLSLPFYPLFVKNVGEKRADSLSIRLYASSGIGLRNDSIDWTQKTSNDKDYPACYVMNFRSVDINAKETWTLEKDWQEVPVYIAPETTNRVVDCKLVIFYGAEEPAEAKFRIKFGTP